MADGGWKGGRLRLADEEDHQPSITTKIIKYDENLAVVIAITSTMKQNCSSLITGSALEGAMVHIIHNSRCDPNYCRQSDDHMKKRKLLRCNQYPDRSKGIIIERNEKKQKDPSNKDGGNKTEGFFARLKSLLVGLS